MYVHALSLAIVHQKVQIWAISIVFFFEGR